MYYAHAPVAWYYGPTAWDPDPARKWHTNCRDHARAGHDGEVLHFDGTAVCTACDPAMPDNPFRRKPHAE